jgi:hypothetical protein
MAGADDPIELEPQLPDALGLESVGRSVACHEQRLEAADKLTRRENFRLGHCFSD